MVKCDVVSCIYNNNCICNSKIVEIVLTHDALSEREYLECDTYECNKSCGNVLIK